MSQLNSVWVFSDNPERYAELFGGAQQWGQQVYAIVQNTDQAQAVMPYGPKCLYVLAQNDALQRTENYAESIAALLKDKHPAMLLLAATKRGKALAARLSVQLNAALVNDATAVDIVDGHICAEHRMYGGLAFAQEKINSPLAIITLAPGVQEPCTSDTSHQCPTETVPYVAPRHEILCRERRAKAASSVDLSKAKRVVGVGRGLAAQDDLKMVHELAAVLNAEVGCSRPIAEGENWMERERYIGVSGVLLKSDLYLTLGISGQIQHMVGGNGAKVIVAINKDKNAPIFNYADYGLVGDISATSKKIIFCGTLTAGSLKTEITDGKLNIVQEGRVKKFIRELPEITFSGKIALERGLDVRYITERAVFTLKEDGLHLIEIAPGVDLQKDILDKMDFTPVISPELKLMDERLFIDAAMGFVLPEAAH